MSQRILVLFAHPTQHRSEANRYLLDRTIGLEGVTVVDLYAEYPTLAIDIAAEQERLLSHDVIVFMFPLYWYSTPAILKEWQDLVLEYGFAYGEGGTELAGKTFFCALTAGGSERGYSAEGYNRFTLLQLLQPLEQTATLCGMRYLPPFALYGARTAIDDGRLQVHGDNWRRLLTALAAGQVDYERAQQYDRLNADIDALLGDAA